MIKKLFLRICIPFVIMSGIAFMLFLIGKTESEYLGTF